jgi:hypothetical protein
MNIKKADTSSDERGYLQIQAVSAANRFPVKDAAVTISSREEPDRILEKFQTDLSGQSEEISLSTPPLAYSMEPDEPRPYSEYDVHIEAKGYEPLDIQGV